MNEATEILVGYGGWKEYIFVIAAIVYVGGMFPLLYYYQTDPSSTFTTLPNLSLISVVGAFLLFAQFFVAALTAPKQKVEKSPQ